MTDAQVLVAVDHVRKMIDTFRDRDPMTTGYLRMYEDLQSTYADALTAVRIRGLPIEEWEGDELIFSPLVDRWVKVDDYRP